MTSGDLVAYVIDLDDSQCAIAMIEIKKIPEDDWGCL